MNRKKKLVDAINQAYSNKKRLHIRFEPIKQVVTMRYIMLGGSLIDSRKL